MTDDEEDAIYQAGDRLDHALDHVKGIKNIIARTLPIAAATARMDLIADDLDAVGRKLRAALDEIEAVITTIESGERVS